MRRMIPFVTLSAAAVASTVALVGCDFTTGSDASVNTSKGASVNINFSGFYSGIIGSAATGPGRDGRAVADTSGAPIRTFVVGQTGNRLDVTDNNGSTYRGNTGSPLLVASPDSDGVIPAGATIAESLFTWEGVDNTSGKRITFTGVVSSVAVTDTQGTVGPNTTQSTTTTGPNTTTTPTPSTFTTIRESTVATGPAVTDPPLPGQFDPSGFAPVSLNAQIPSNVPVGGSVTVSVPDPFTAGGTIPVLIPGPATRGMVVTLVVDVPAAASTARTVSVTLPVTTTGPNTTQTSGTTGPNTTNTFSIGASGTQFRLRGTWIEEGGKTSNVDAISEGGVAVTFSVPDPP